MAEVSGTEAVIAVLGRWAPGDLAFIERLEYSAASLDAGAALMIDALFQRGDLSKPWPSPSGNCCRVSLLFTDPVNLALKGFSGRAKQIEGFFIEDISDRQWEGIRFSVGDHEDGYIAFLCREVRVLQASPLLPASNPAFTAYPQASRWP
jgi:hypothetical protein